MSNVRRIAERARFVRAFKSGDKRASMPVPGFRVVTMPPTDEQKVSGLRTQLLVRGNKLRPSWKLWRYRLAHPPVITETPPVEP